jgi:hypothetical protein
MVRALPPVRDVPMSVSAKTRRADGEPITHGD